VQILGMSQQSLTQGIQVLLVLVFTYHHQQSQHHRFWVMIFVSFISVTCWHFNDA
jgi:hypothetical protein